MDTTYITIEKPSFVYEQILKKSRFIVQMQRVHNENEAHDFIQQIQKKHNKANHNVWTYVLGPHSEIQRAADDGEPSGTAGTPMLEVLNNNQLRDVVVVQTRYFGGIKLGAGGLIRAYAGTLADAIMAGGLVQKILQQELVIQIDYPQFEIIKYWLAEHALDLMETNFTEKVTMVVPVDLDSLDTVMEQLRDLTKGQAELIKRDQIWHEVPFHRGISGQTKTRY